MSDKEWLESIQTKTSEVMVENKTIVITDPCYVSDCECEEWKDKYSPYIVKNTLYGDWSCHVYRGNKEEIQNIIDEWDNFYVEWWEKYNFGGINEEEKSKLLEEYKQKEKEFKEKYVYGSFCADAGMVAVYDASKLPQGVIDNLREDSHCACFIENYTGPIKYVIEEGVYEDGEKYRSAHIVGDGFYSSQSGF